jgi:hypothetical protein
MLCEYRACRADGSNWRAQSVELARLLHGRSAEEIRHRVCVLLVAESAWANVQDSNGEVTSPTSSSEDSQRLDSGGVRNRVVPSFACVAPDTCVGSGCPLPSSSAEAVTQRSAQEQGRSRAHSAKITQGQQSEENQSSAARIERAAAPNVAAVLIDLT